MHYLSRYLLLSFVFAFFNSHLTLGQEEGPSFFVGPEVMIGKLVGNYGDFPDVSMRKNFVLSLGRQQNTLENSWAKYYNFPATGVSLSFSDLGNKNVFGYEYAVIPFIILSSSKHHQKAWYLKLGLGASYFTKTFADNIENEAIGSKFTWAFQTFVYRNIYAQKHLNLKLGAGFLHGSNSHVQLPNFGINAAMISLSAQWFNKSFDSAYSADNTQEIDREKHFFIQIRNGLGFHEYGGTRIPVGGDNRPVYTIALSGGVVYRNHIKVRTGFAYRYYEQYYHKIMSGNDEAYTNKANWNASNVYWFLGSELLIGHIGLNFEGGINFHKPYFSVYYDEFGADSGFKEFLKRTFNSRLGLNLYAKNTNKNPKHNIFVGANISTNFGQADFAEGNFGYVMRIR